MARTARTAATGRGRGRDAAAPARDGRRSGGRGRDAAATASKS